MGQQSLIYSFVARGTVILADYIEFTGNFTSIAAQCLQKLPATYNKFTSNCDGHTFKYLVDNGFTYCVVAVESVGREVLIAFLERIKEDFTKKYGGGKAATAVANSLNKEFGPKLKEQMQYCVDHPEEVSKLAKVKAQVSGVKGVMMENIEKVHDRGEKIECLVDKTENLRSQSPVTSSTGGLSAVRGWWLHAVAQPELAKAIMATGFGDIARSLQTTQLSDATLAALTERWCDISKTFHLAVGEVTITPSDMVAITGLPWSGTVIHFDTNIERFSRSPIVRGQVIELFGVEPRFGVLAYPELVDHWTRRSPIPASEIPRYVRSFVITLLSVTFFPVVISEINYGLIPFMVDIDRISGLNWPRAILAQMYFGLDLVARAHQKALQCCHLILQAWAFGYGFYPSPGFSVAPAGSLCLARICSTFEGGVLSFEGYRERLCHLKLEQVDRDPWSELTHYRMVKKIRKEVDRNRFIMEGPRARKWYLGERIQYWRTKSVADRRIPPMPPSKLFFVHLMITQPEDIRLYNEEHGMRISGQRGDYEAFIRDKLILLRPSAQAVVNQSYVQQGRDNGDRGIGSHAAGASGIGVGCKEVTKKRSRVPDLNAATEGSSSTSSSIIEGRLMVPLDTSFYLLGYPGTQAERTLPQSFHTLLFDPPDATHFAREEMEQVARHSLALRDLMFSQNGIAMAIDAERADYERRYRELEGRYQDLDVRYQGLDARYQSLDAQHQELVQRIIAKLDQRKSMKCG